MFPARWGMETLTTVVSRISMNVASMTAVVTIHGLMERRGSTGFMTASQRVIIETPAGE